MNETQYRAWRMRLRQVTAALVAEAVAGGATSKQLGVMDCVADPVCPAEGFVTPRHGAVWVPDAQVRDALNELQALGGPIRLRLLDGLYPPAFVAAMRRMDLRVVEEHPLLVLALDVERSPAQPDYSARPVLTPEDAVNWSALAGPQAAAPPGGRDWLLACNSEAVGAARFGAAGARAARLLHWHGDGPGSDPAQILLLLTTACSAPALDVDLLFAEADHADDRAALRTLGFRDSGAVLTLEGIP